MNEKNGFLGQIDKSVFWISAVIAVIFVLWAVVFPEGAGASFGAVQGFLTKSFGWSYLMVVAAFLVFCIWIAFSRYGSIRLGKDDEKPEFSTLSWFAMLFSAGMGIGLVFWSIAEPMYHYGSPPFGEASSIESAGIAMRYVFFHWGLHPWATFALGGLILAYWQFRKGKPALFSSTFTPLLGEDAPSTIWGKVIDILAVFATLFGVATSLGLGAQQINSGLAFNFNIPNTTTTTLIVIAVITVLFIISAVTGIKRGIQTLSNINIYLASFLMLFILFTGPTKFILDLFSSSLGEYLQNIVRTSFWTDAFNTSEGWVGGWTIFYWAWWIAWVPFVGGFIARISRGRTIKEFMIGVLVAPTVVSFIWLTIFGGTAINIEMFGAGGIAEAVSADMSTALFVTVDHLPLAGLISVLAIIMIATFFITSADSATFVMGEFTSGGSLEPTSGLKIVWGLIEGAVAGVLLYVGGLSALQTASIASAFPFMIVMILATYALLKALRAEVQSTEG